MADRRAQDVATALGKALRNARKGRSRRQIDIGEAAGVAQTTVSKMERGHGASISLQVWARCARAAGSDLHAYLEHVSSADQPRDIAHLRAQELLTRMALPGGWRPTPERALDDPARGSRAADLTLERHRPDAPSELALLEVFDWFDDVGAAFRSWDGKLARLERLAIARMTGTDVDLPRVSGCWIVRATRRNRTLIAANRATFAARFPGSGTAWLAALADVKATMPPQPALLWVDLRATRLSPARLPASMARRMSDTA